MALHSRLNRRPAGYRPAHHIIVLYDNNCTLCIYIGRRFTEWFQDIAHLLNDDSVDFVVPLVHINGHSDDCMYLYGIIYKENSGHFHSETAEQYWTESNQLAPQTRQVNGGHCQDTLMDHHNDWGWKKTMNLGKHLLQSIVD